MSLCTEIRECKKTNTLVTHADNRLTPVVSAVSKAVTSALEESPALALQFSPVRCVS